MDFKDLLMLGALASMSEGKEAKEATIEESEDLYKKYLDLKSASDDIKPGDRIELNHIGKKRYQYPKKDGIAVCVRKLDQPQVGSDGFMTDMVVMMTLGTDKFIHAIVDGSYFKVSGSRDKLPDNVFKMKRREVDTDGE